MDNNSEIPNENIILSYEGDLGPDEMARIFENAENALKLSCSEPGIVKTTYAIFIEFLQNLFHHAENIPTANGIQKLVKLLLFKDDNNYYIQSENYIKNNNIQALKLWLNQVNAYSPQELKEAYAQILQNSDFSEKGGANLGIIDMVRKSKNPLSYKFEDVDENGSLLKLKAIISYKPFQSLKIGRTKNTPEILFNPTSGLLQISGRLIPENAYGFYSPIIHWLNIYCAQPAGNTILEVFVDYVNTSSSKYFIEIMRRLQRIENWGNRSVVIKWYYEKGDMDMYETGLDYQEICKLNFEIIEK